MSIPQSTRMLPALALGAALAALAPPALAQSPPPALHWALTDVGTLGGDSRVIALNAHGRTAGSSTLANGAQHAFLSGPGGIVDLGTLDGARNSNAHALNDAGQAIGTSYDDGDRNNTAFLYDAGGMRRLGDLGGAAASARAINASGQVAGSAVLPTGVSHAFRSGPNGAGMSDLGTLGGPHSWGLLINDAGQVAGVSQTSYQHGATERAFLYGDNGMTDLGTLGGDNSEVAALNASGQVAGTSAVAGNGVHAFLYSDGAMRDLGTLGGIGSEARALNDAGMVAGWSWTANGEQHPFLFADGVMHDLGALGAVGGIGTGNGMALAINASGQVAGFSSTDYGESIFFYSGGQMIDLGARLRGRYHAIDHRVYLNDAGQVAGFAISDLTGQARSFLLTPLAMVPEPAPFALLALGVAALGLARRLRPHRPGRI